MRRAQQQDILSIIETMEQVHKEIGQALEKKEVEFAKQMLAECQECAIELGSVIEQIEGKNFVSVAYLEKYCDIVYLMFESVDQENNSAKIAKMLRKALFQVENSIKNDVKVRKEVVFFPYKASMWDSLESIYLTALKDDECDVYCVPIPYYDCRADGSMGTMHYEGNEYPKNIKITDYRTYNLEERHPDVIYIHNPYDGWNHVTSVPQRYYAKNLCHYTDELVYIPYFILAEPDASDQGDVDGMKHFCFLPGVIYSHKVIVQSENVRQIYITEYIRAAKEYGLAGQHVDRKFQEQKILGLGSPKVDKVLNTRKEDVEIPEEWLEIMNKPDGTCKKIVFYNTTINGLLHNDERMLQKMERVLEIFKENQDKVALLWRPHPLIENTLTSMRPQLWGTYKKIRDRYIEDRWGIYDDTTDMNRAVALSDAYYGDQSSVLQLYKRTGKKILIQNANIGDFNKAELLFGAGCAVSDKKMFLMSFNANILLEIELSKKNIRIYELNKESNMYRILYTDIAFFEGKVYLAPTHSKSFAVYDSVTESIEYTEIDSSIKKLRSHSWDTSFIVPSFYDRYIFYVGINQTSGVAKYNLETKEIIYFNNELAQEYGDSFRLYSGKGIVIENELILPLYNQCNVLGMDVITGECRIIVIDEQISEKIRTVDKVNNIIYFSTETGTIFSWSYYEKRVIDYIKKGEGQGFIKSVVTKNKIYYYPQESGTPIVHVSLVSNTYGQLGNLPSYLNSATYDPINDKVILNTGLGIYVQNETGEMELLSCVVSEAQISELQKKLNDSVFDEGNPRYMSLKYFLTIL